MSSLDARLERGRKILEEGDFFRILTHYDVDGVCSAGIIAGYLNEMGKRFHISFFRNGEADELVRIAKDEEYVIFTDMGSALVDELDGNIIVLDHHKPRSDNEKIVHINPHLFGYDGAIEATATTMAYLLVYDRKYARCLFAGMLGDKQYLPGEGPVGLNREIMDKLGVKPIFDFPFYGNVADALFYSVEPFFPGISGRRDEIEKMLKKLGIAPGKDINELTEEQKVRLGSYLSLNLIKHSRIPDAGKFIVDLDFNINGESVRYLTELIDSACRTGNQGIALSYILGDDEAYDKMEVMRRDYRGEVIEEMYSMLANMEERKNVQYFYAKNSYLSSTVATIGTLYLLNPQKVTIAMHMDSVVSISARVYRSLMDRIDLGKLMHEISSKLGGRGGGHSVAAGATIPRGREEEFITRLDEAVENILSS